MLLLILNYFQEVRPMLLARRLPRWLLFGVMVITVSLLQPGAGIGAQPKAPSVDLNKASLQELESLKGVGPATAKKIIDSRPYTSVDDLTKAGLSAKQIEALKPLVTVGPAQATTPPATATAEKSGRPEKPIKPAESAKTGKPIKPAESAKTAEPGKLVDLNTASRGELETLPGIGKISADKIIAGRPYAKVEDLTKAGIPEKNIGLLKPLVTISPAKATTAGEGAKKPGESASVDLNKATQAELESLPGIGKASAHKIIANRPYASVEDLAKAGLNLKQIADLRSRVTISAMPAAPASPAPAKAAPASPAAPSAAPAPAPAPAAAPAAAPTKVAPAPKLAPGQKVNINTASKDMLDALPEIGPVKAQAIIDNRPYKKIEDIMKVKGIKEGTFDKIKDMITVD
jgi:competence protein ComEA